MAQPWWEERVPPLSRRELFGAPWKGEGPLPLMGVAPQLQPLEGMLLRRSTDIYPKELARDMRQFFSSLLGHSRIPIAGEVQNSSQAKPARQKIGTSTKVFPEDSYLLAATLITDVASLLSFLSVSDSSVKVC